MILNRQRTVRVARPPLEAFLARVREQLRLNGSEITIALVSDPAIARMNETYRHKRGPTDVLSFPSVDLGAASDPGFVGASLQGAQAQRQHVSVPSSRRGHVRAQDSCAPGPHDRSDSRLRRQRKTKILATPDAHILGDIAISPATARRNAKKFGRTLPIELQILILHGVLHLLGYDHETDNGQMTRIENRLRRKLGLQ
jgi:rRNA maturation RNase YbeY